MSLIQYSLMYRCTQKMLKELSENNLNIYTHLEIRQYSCGVVPNTEQIILRLNCSIYFPTVPKLWTVVKNLKKLLHVLKKHIFNSRRIYIR